MGKFCFRFIKRQTIFAIFLSDPQTSPASRRQRPLPPTDLLLLLLLRLPLLLSSPRFERIQNLCYMRRAAAGSTNIGRELGSSAAVSVNQAEGERETERGGQ